jgi:hypothetical protein
MTTVPIYTVRGVRSSARPRLGSSLRDAVGLVVVPAGAQPPLEADDGDLVVPADPVEQVDELARVAHEQVAVFGGVPCEPADGGFVVEDGRVLADQQEQRERVCKANPTKLGCGGERDVGVAGLQRTLEPGVGVAPATSLGTHVRTPQLPRLTLARDVAAVNRARGHAADD